MKRKTSRLRRKLRYKLNNEGEDEFIEYVHHILKKRYTIKKLKKRFDDFLENGVMREERWRFDDCLDQFIEYLKKKNNSSL